MTFQPYFGPRSSQAFWIFFDKTYPIEDFFVGQIAGQITDYFSRTTGTAIKDPGVSIIADQQFMFVHRSPEIEIPGCIPSGFAVNKYPALRIDFKFDIVTKAYGFIDFLPSLRYLGDPLCGRIGSLGSLANFSTLFDL
jgi:hypothetical protein